MAQDLNEQLEKLRKNAVEEVHEVAAAMWTKDLFFPSMKDIVELANQDPDKYPRISAYFAARKILIGDEERSDKELLKGE